MPKTSKKSGKKKKKQPITRPRGMRDIMGEEFYAYQGFFEKASEIALYYGFSPIETPIIEKEEVFTSGVGAETDIIQKEMYALKTKGRISLVMRPEGTAGIMRAYIEGGLYTKPQPLMLYYYGPFFRYERPQKGRWRQFYQFGLEVLGTEKAIIDAIVIKTTITIIEEAGIKNICVRLNTIGDQDCRPAYIKALVAYYRKHINDLCSNCRQRIKTNPLRLLDCNDKDCQSFKDEAPQIIGYICEPCKKHFKEVLEYLDTIGIDYQIDHTLVRGIDYYTRTVFEVVSEIPVKETRAQKKEKAALKEAAQDEESGDNKSDNSKKSEKEDEQEEEKEETQTISLAGGGRYNNLAKHLGSKRDVPGIGVGIGVDRVIEMEDFKSCAPRIIKKPKAYFIQIGNEAKLKSINIIEILRKAKMPIFQALTKNQLSVQLALAEKMSIPYTIILGQKEALEGTVIVRDMKSRSQKTVKVEDLAEYLKKK